MHDEIKIKIKKIMVETLNLDESTVQNLAEDTPLIGSSIGLDSIDVLELIVRIEKEFGVKIENGEQAKTALASLGSLINFIQQKQKAKG